MMADKQLADKVIDSMPNGDGTFMGVNLREFSKKQLIKIMYSELSNLNKQIQSEKKTIEYQNDVIYRLSTKNDEYQFSGGV